jgi:translation elongation factor EF-Tu-like GTPase
MAHNAIVRFLDKGEGGRTLPPMSGYSPHMKIGKEHTTCRITPKDSDVEVMKFGTDYEVSIEFPLAEHYPNQITPGMNVGLYEGSRLVGHGYLMT